MARASDADAYTGDTSVSCVTDEEDSNRIEDTRSNVIFDSKHDDDDTHRILLHNLNVTSSLGY